MVKSRKEATAWAKFLIGPLPLAERLHHLNALYIFHDHAVHMGVGLHVGGVILVIGPHPEGHGDERHRDGHQQGKAHPPVDGEHGDDHDQRQQKIGTEFRDHVSQRRLHIFNTVYMVLFMEPMGRLSTSPSGAPISRSAT